MGNSILRHTLVIYQYIYVKTYTAQLYFILGKTELHFKFSSLLRDAPDIHIFPTVYMVKIYVLII